MPSLEENKKRFMMQKAKERFMAKKRGPEKFSQWEAGLRGAYQGATLDQGDEISAGLSTGFGMLGDYDKEVADQRRQNKESAGQWPKTALGAELGAGLATSLIPGVGQAGAVVKAGKVAQYMNKLRKASTAKKALGTAAVGGGIQGVGASEEKFIDNPMALADDAAMGVGVGLGGQALLGGVAKGIKALPKAATEGSQKRGVKAAIGESMAHRRKMMGMTANQGGDIRVGDEKLRRAGQDLLDERMDDGSKLLKGGMSTSDLAPRISDTKKKYGKQLGRIQDYVDGVKPEGAVDVNSLKDKLLGVIDEIGDISTGIGHREKVLEIAEQLENKFPDGKTSFKELKKLKQVFKYKAADKDAHIGNQDVVNMVNQAFAKQLEESTDDAFKLIPDIPGLKAGQPGPPSKADSLKEMLGKNDYKEIKRKYGSMKNLESASADRANRNDSINMLSPSSKAAGMSAGVRTGDTMFSATMAMANQIVTERGASVASRSLEKVANLMKTDNEFLNRWGGRFQKALERGPAAMVATHHLLKKDPEYQRYMEEKK
jgi:hypothetical protein